MWHMYWHISRMNAHQVIGAYAMFVKNFICGIYIYWHTSPMSAHQVIRAYAMFVVFEGHICCWDILYNNMVN